MISSANNRNPTTFPQDGSYSLHSDAESGVMEPGGPGNNSNSSSRGSYEMYEDQRRSMGELSSGRNPNLGQAPGCPGSLPESAQVCVMYLFSQPFFPHSEV